MSDEFVDPFAGAPADEAQTAPPAPPEDAFSQPPAEAAPPAPPAEPAKKAPAKKAPAKAAGSISVDVKPTLSGLSVEAPVTTTFKGGTGFDAPWVVLRSNTVAEALDQLSGENAVTLNAFMERVQLVGQRFAQLSGGGNGGQATARPARQAAPAAAQQPPAGSPACPGPGWVYRTGTTKSGPKAGQTWQAWMPPTRRRPLAPSRFGSDQALTPNGMGPKGPSLQQEREQMSKIRVAFEDAFDSVRDAVDRVADYFLAKAFQFWVWLGAALDVSLVVQVPRPEPWVITKEVPVIDTEAIEQLAALRAKNEGLAAELSDVKYARAVAVSDGFQLKDALEAAHAENRELQAQLAAERDGRLLAEQRNQRAAQSFGEAIFGDRPTTAGPERPNRPKLTDREVAEIREMKRSGWKNVDIAAAFDVNRATISRIVRGQYHKAA